MEISLVDACNDPKDDLPQKFKQIFVVQLKIAEHNLVGSVVRKT